MKSESFQKFSPTSAGVRSEHVNLKDTRYTVRNTNNSNNNNNQCCMIEGKDKNQSFGNTNTFSLPRVWVPPPPLSQSTYTCASIDKYQKQQHSKCLEQVIVHQHQDSRKKDKKKSNKMRNCLVITGVTLIACMLSLVLFVECRSVKSTPSKRLYDDQISLESGIHEATIEPEAESSEEVPSKVVTTTVSSKEDIWPSPTSSLPPNKAPTTKRSVSSTDRTKNGRLTRSRVSVICRGGYAETRDDDDLQGSTWSPKNVNLPTLLPRVSDDNSESKESDEDEDWDDDEARISNQESRPHQIVTTVTGYSHVSGGKPETKSLKKAASVTSVKYVPTSSTTTEKLSTVRSSKKKHSRDLSSEEIESSEEYVIKPPKASKSSKQSRHQKSKGEARAETERPSSTPSSSNKSTKKERKHQSDKHHNRHKQSKRESSEEEEEDSEEVVTLQAPTRSSSSTKGHQSRKSSKKSSKSQTTPSSRSVSKKESKNEKGDSGEIEEDVSLLPTFRKLDTNGEARKTSARRQPPPFPIPISITPDPDLDLESAEAEPTSFVEVRTESSSSRKSSKSGRRSGSKKEEPVTQEYSSEEFLIEEMPAPHEKKESSKRSKSRSSMSRSAKITTPKLRTRPYESMEEGD